MKEPELVILIDDDEINNFINESILKSNLTSSKIVSYVDPIDAIKFFLEDYIHNPVVAIIFLDINMPQMSGWEILDELEKHSQSLSPFLTIFMTSSSIDSTDKARSMKNSLVKDFVSKPLSKELVENLFKN